MDHRERRPQCVGVGDRWGAPCRLASGHPDCDVLPVHDQRVVNPEPLQSQADQAYEDDDARADLGQRVGRRTAQEDQQQGEGSEEVAQLASVHRCPHHQEGWIGPQPRSHRLLAPKGPSQLRRTGEVGGERDVLHVDAETIAEQGLLLGREGQHRPGEVTQGAARELLDDRHLAVGRTQQEDRAGDTARRALFRWVLRQQQVLARAAYQCGPCVSSRAEAA